MSISGRIFLAAFCICCLCTPALAALSVVSVTTWLNCEGGIVHYYRQIEFSDGTSVTQPLEQTGSGCSGTGWPIKAALTAATGSPGSGPSPEIKTNLDRITDPAVRQSRNARVDPALLRQLGALTRQGKVPEVQLSPAQLSPAARRFFENAGKVSPAEMSPLIELGKQQRAATGAKSIQ